MCPVVLQVSDDEERMSVGSRGSFRVSITATSEWILIRKLSLDLQLYVFLLCVTTEHQTQRSEIHIIR